jgi:large subunit ribosomal protein L10
LIHRIGSIRRKAIGDAGEHAEAGHAPPCGGRAPAFKASREAPSQGRRDSGQTGSATRHRRAPAVRPKLEGSMPTEAKRETVAGLRAALAGSRTLIVSEYRGLTVKEIAEIRRALRKQDVSYRVVKNRLMRIAASDSVGEALSPLLVGPTAIAFGNDESTTAKAVLDATRPYKLVTVTGGVLGDRSIDADGVRTLASLPSREVLLGKLAGGMQAPIATLAGLLVANIRNLGYALSQVRDQKSQAEGA